MPDIKIPEGYYILTDTFTQGDLFRKLVVSPQRESSWSTVHTNAVKSVADYTNYIFIRKITKTEKGNILN